MRTFTLANNTSVKANSKGETQSPLKKALLPILKITLFTALMLVQGMAVGQTTIAANGTVAASAITAGNNIVMNSGSTLNMDVTRTFGTLTVQNTTTSSNTIRTGIISGNGVATFGSISVSANASGTSSTSRAINFIVSTGSTVVCTGVSPTGNRIKHMTINGTLRVSESIATGWNSVTFASGSLVEYNGTTAQTIYNAPYSNLTLSGSGIKTLNTETVISANLSITGSAEANLTGTANITATTLTLANTGKLTINPGASLTVNNNLSNASENGAAAIQLLSNSTANASLIHNNTGVPATVKRTFSLQSKFHFISSPVTETVSLNNVFPTDQNKIWVRVWNEATGAWVNQLAAGIMEPGIGYSFYMNIPQTTAIFEGTLNTEGVTVVLSNIGTLGNARWNLIGNPFSSAIDWSKIGTQSGITGQVAVWSGAIGNYFYYQSGSGTLFNGIIPPNQAMFVQAVVNGSPSITIPATARVHNIQSLYKSNKTATVETLRLDITNEDNAYRDAAFIRFHPEATQGFDNYLDAHKLFGETNAPQLFFTAGDLNLSINALPAIEEKMEIPLSIRTGVNTTYTISTSGIESFDPAQAIFLKDLLTGARIDLGLDSEYSFQTIPDPEVPEVRFVVQFFDATVDAPDIENEMIRLFSFDKTVCAYTPEVSGATLALTNMLGQRVFQTFVNGAGLHSFETGLSPGLYILSLQTGKAMHTQQIIIK